MRIFKIFLVLLFVMVGLVLIYYAGQSEYVTLARVKTIACQLNEFVQTRYVWSVTVFIALCIVLMSVCLPLVGPIAIISSSLFGLWPGVFYSMVGITVGVSISFVMLRYLFSQFVLARYGAQLATFQERMHVYGYTYLVSLHLLSVVPYFIITTIAALAGVPFYAFVWTTIVGSLPLVIIYAFAGQELCMIQSWGDVISMRMLILLLILAILALLPMVARRFKWIG